MSPARLAHIGLGANLDSAVGSPAQTLGAAVTALAALPHTGLDGASRVYASEPVDADGPPYFNQVVRLRTRLPPQALLAELQAIESRFGRERPHHNAPRTLDLDLLLLGGLVVSTAQLVVPHPRLHQRLFVLMPLAELDPGLLVPGRGRVADLLHTVTATGTQRCAPVDG